MFFLLFFSYDAHHIIRALGYDESEVFVLATSEEKFITFSKRIDKLDLRFVDTLRFMSCNLDQLAKNLPRDVFHHTEAVFHDKPSELIELLKQKAVFCYEYVDSIDKLNDLQLPAKEKFYSSRDSA